MSEAWEWRGFRAASGVPGLEEQALSLARRLEVVHDATVRHEEDVYLISPQLAHSIKLRRGALEIKRRQKVRKDGYSLWSEKLRWSFPLSPRRLLTVSQLLSAPRPAPGSALSMEALCAGLREVCSVVAAVNVRKRRMRVGKRRTHLELVDVELPRGLRLRSYCIMGEDRDVARALLDKSGLRPEVRPLGYPDLLREATFWYPDLCYAEAP